MGSSSDINGNMSLVFFVSDRGSLVLPCSTFALEYLIAVKEHGERGRSSTAFFICSSHQFGGME